MSISKSLNATICVSPQNEKETSLVRTWLSKWETRITLCEEHRCDDSLELYEVIAPENALKELPDHVVMERAIHRGIPNEVQIITKSAGYIRS